MAKAGDSPNQEAPELRMWMQLVIDSLIRPRLAARQVLALGAPPAVLAQAAVLSACLGMLLGYVALRLSPAAVDPISAALIAQPLRGAALQLAVMAIAVFLTTRIGGLFGGTGSLRGALALVVWLNLMMVGLQALQLAALLFAPPATLVIFAATIAWLIWAFPNFVAELHGFGNTLVVLAVTILALIVLSFGFATLLALLGFGPRGAG